MWKKSNTLFGRKVNLRRTTNPVPRKPQRGTLWSPDSIIFESLKFLFLTLSLIRMKASNRMYYVQKKAKGFQRFSVKVRIVDNFQTKKSSTSHLCICAVFHCFQKIKIIPFLFNYPLTSCTLLDYFRKFFYIELTTNWLILRWHVLILKLFK